MAEKIVIDAGHNGLTDPGAVYNGQRESDDALRLAMAVGEILLRNGYAVDYTRTKDLNQSVSQKAKLANEAGADLFLSLHRNMASYPGQYNGAQTLLYDLSGTKLTMAENINQNLEGVGFQNLGVEARPDLAILRETDMPSLLIEVGFIDSDADNQIFERRLEEIAEAIADGVMDTLTIAGSDGDDLLRYAKRTEEPDDAPTLQTQEQSKAADSRQELYRVQVGAFYNLRNAIELEQELKRLGYNPWIVTM